MRRLITLIVTALVVGLTCNAQAKTIHVKVGGTGNGSSWSSAYGNLQTALDDAEPNDSIWVAEGTYTPTKLIDPCDVRTATFQMKNGVGIYGDFPSVGDPNWESRDWEKYETVLSGDLLGNDVDVGDPCDLISDPCRADNCYHVLYHPNDTNLDTSAVLDGFSVTGGNADSTGDHLHGGGMYNHTSYPKIIHCTFSYNSAVIGGGMCNFENSPIVSNCLFADNYGLVFGGAMYNHFSNPYITNCSFVGNAVQLFGGGITNRGGSISIISYCTFTNNESMQQGGGVYNIGSDANITFCTFQSNSAYLGGGMCNNYSNPTINNCIFTNNQYNGIWNEESSPIVTHCEFTNNIGVGMENFRYCSPKVTHCAFTGNMGSGMVNYGESNPIVTSCIFSGNSTEFLGGGMYNYGGSSPIVTSCIFSGNKARYGGGICLDYTGSTITNCIFTGNSAVDGGGVYYVTETYSTRTTINNCTFSGNSADANGGAIWNDAGYSYYMKVKNCILWGNTDHNDVQICNADSVVTVTYSDIQGGYPGTGNINTDPLFIDPNGPDNIPGTEDDNLHLLPYSPCIDAGDPSGDYTNQTDIDGEQRTLYDNVDIGADEVFPIAGDIDQDGDVDFRDYAYFSMHWLKGK